MLRDLIYYSYAFTPVVFTPTAPRICQRKCDHVSAPSLFQLLEFKGYEVGADSAT